MSPFLINWSSISFFCGERISLLEFFRPNLTFRSHYILELSFVFRISEPNFFTSSPAIKYLPPWLYTHKNSNSCILFMQSTLLASPPPADRPSHNGPHSAWKHLSNRDLNNVSFTFCPYGIFTIFLIYFLTFSSLMLIYISSSY